MGWTYPYNTSTKAELVAYITAPSRFGEHKLLKSRVVGKCHWYLAKKPDGHVYIGLDLLDTAEPNEPGWGYKDLDETCGPCETSCPVSFVKEASPTSNEYALEWREKVKEAAVKAAERVKAKSLLKAGDSINWEGATYTLVSSLGPRMGWIVTRVGQTQFLRMKQAYIAKSEICSDQEEV